jgi:uncharacterized protein (TIGR03083 family)
MSEWDATTYEAKDNLLRVVRREAAQFFELAEQPSAWEAETACAGWQVRDLVGHLVDVTETYFERFDAARGHTDVGPAHGTRGMAARADEQARAFRDQPQAEFVERLRTDFDKMMGIFEALGPDEWGGLMVPHYYMGPLPAYFYPTFQLMDYGVHSWDIRQGTGRAHALAGDAADFLVPFMFILWQATCDVEQVTEPLAVGIRVASGHNAGGWRLYVSPEGLTYEPGDLASVGSVIEFDPGSFVLTAFGRINGGTVRGAQGTATRFLNQFFRI